MYIFFFLSLHFIHVYFVYKTHFYKIKCMRLNFDSNVLEYRLILALAMNRKKEEILLNDNSIKMRYLH